MGEGAACSRRADSLFEIEVEAAEARGVFGPPFVIVGDRRFWGHDHLDQVERWLETGGWWTWMKR